MFVIFSELFVELIGFLQLKVFFNGDSPGDI